MSGRRNKWQVGIHCYFRNDIPQDIRSKILYGLDVALEIGSRALLNKKTADYSVHLMLKTIELNPNMFGPLQRSLGPTFVSAKMRRSPNNESSTFTGVNEENPISIVYQGFDTYLADFKIKTRPQPLDIGQIESIGPSDAVTVSALASDQYGNTAVGATTRSHNVHDRIHSKICLLDKGQCGVSVIGEADPSFLGSNSIPFQKWCEDQKVNPVDIPSGSSLSVFILHSDKQQPNLAHVYFGTENMRQGWFVFKQGNSETFASIIQEVPLEEGKYHEATLCPQDRPVRDIEMACPDTGTLDTLDRCTQILLQKLPALPSDQKFLIFSPVTAKVSCVRPYSITFYLQAFTSHDVHSPISGTVTHVKGCQGMFHREELLWFKADPNKNARLSIQIRGKHLCLEFWLEVGKKDWQITDRMFLQSPKAGESLENQYVDEGDRLGALVLGSMAEMHFPHHAQLYYRILVKKDDNMVGGRTPIVMYSFQEL